MISATQGTDRVIQDIDTALQSFSFIESFRMKSTYSKFKSSSLTSSLTSVSNQLFVCLFHAFFVFKFQNKTTFNYTE